MIEDFRRPSQHHHHPRPTDEVASDVQKWMPAAEIERDNNQWVVIDRSARFSFPSSDTEAGAWESAFTEMQTVNAYYLSGPPDCLVGTALDNWLEAEVNIENGLIEPAELPRFPAEEPAVTAE
jgi:hypothetical protein